MILRTIHPQHTQDEKELRLWLQQNLGVEDAELLAGFVWEIEHRSPNAAEEYLSGLAQIVIGVVRVGPVFVGSLLTQARRPKDVRQAEHELMVFASEILPPLVARIKKHDGASEAIKHAADELITRARERIEKMWPGKPDYIVNSAVACGVVHKDGAFSIDAAAIAKCMLQEDVLKSARGG